MIEFNAHYLPVVRKPLAYKPPYRGTVPGFSLGMTDSRND